MRAALVALLASSIAACGVSPVDAPRDACPRYDAPPGDRGLVAIDTDYQSTNVALVGWNGASVRSLVSSRSAPAGLSAALSGDVVVPSHAPASGEIVLLDRGSGVVTWIDRACGVRAQLSLGDFHPQPADPYDYVELGGKAYVLRYGENAAPSGRLDRGGDVAVVDPAIPVVTGVIDLAPYVPASPAGARPNPAAMLVRGDRVLVSLEGFTADSRHAADATLVAIDPARDAVDWSVTIAGAKNCGAMAALPDGRIVLACSSYPLAMLRPSDENPLATSAIVVLADTSDGRLAETMRLAARDVRGLFLQAAIAVADDRRVVFADYGDMDSGANDGVFVADLGVSPPTYAALATSTGVDPIGLACRDRVCVVTDTAGGLRRFDFATDTPVEIAPLALADPFGLPPRSISAF